MILENGGYLWLLLLIPCHLFYSFRSFGKASNVLYRFARTKKRPLPFAVSTLCFSCALGAVIFSLAEPKVNYNKIVFNRSGIDVAIGIDVSKSMLAEDEMLPSEGKKLFAIPNRLNCARYFALSIISALQGERVAVFMFASKGVSIIPLTSDYGYCQYILKHFNDAAIAIPGSDLSQAIGTGVSLFEGTPRTSVKTIILLSDGEDINDDKSPIFEAAQRAAARGVAIYTVGTGMGRSVLIPVRDAAGSAVVDYYKDEDGAYLKTRLEQDTLKRIAALAGGGYVRAYAGHSADDIVDAIVQRAKTKKYTQVTVPAWFYISPLLLGAALIIFLLGIITGR